MSVGGSLVVIHVYEFKVAGSSGKNYTLNSTQLDVIDFKFYFRFWYFLRDLNSHPFGPSFELGVSTDSTKEAYGSEGGVRTHDILINSQAQLPTVLPRNIKVGKSYAFSLSDLLKSAAYPVKSRAVLTIIFFFGLTNQLAC